MDNSIVIANQTPQQAGVTTPKAGEKLWIVVTDNGNVYNPTSFCVANHDQWSTPLDLTTGGGGGGGLTQTVADSLYATIAQGGKADTALQPSSTLDATKLSGLVPTTSIPTSFATDAEVAAAYQPLDGDLTAIAAISDTSTGLYRKTAANTATALPVGATGVDSIAAADHAAGRGAIGLESLGVNRFPGVGGATKSFNLNYKPLTNAYIANSYFGGELANGVGQFVDRLLGAHKRYFVSSTGFTSVDSVFDAGYESLATLAAGTTGTITIDFLTPPQTGSKFLYGTGFLVVTFYEYYPANIEYPASLLIEAQDSTGAWITVANKTDFDTAAWSGKMTPFFFPILQLNQKTLRYTVTARSGKTCQITKLEYFADRPDLFETAQYPVSAGDRQDIHAEYLFTNNSRASQLLVGPGQLQFNSGAIQTASLRGTKTIGTASITDTITVTGAAIGDIVRVSRGRDAYISAPNTVTFDSTGLAGVSVTAIVERFI